MADESKVVEPPKKEPEEVVESKASQSAQVESEDEASEHDEPSTSKEGAEDKKKKKSKRKRVKAALTGGALDASSGSSKDDKFHKTMSGMSDAQVSTLLAMNPALARQIGVADGDTAGKEAIAALKKLNLEDVMTGLAASGKNVKDMASYKFWQTQPVPKLGEKDYIEEEGPFKIIDLETVAKETGPLIEGFEWVTMDLENEGEVKEVFELLYGHYVEDEEAMFRFNYSESFFKWALLSPGWQKEFHVGVRATQSRKLVAFISAIPVDLRVRKTTFKASEVNFLCIHKKLRSKRLAPVLIKEITRRSHLQGIWQGLYTAGIVLPKPISTCRYYHRSINWQKLFEVGFSPLPKNSKPQYQVRKYALPDNTATKGLRPMEAKDVDAVVELLNKFLGKFDLAPNFTRAEVDHWLLHKLEVYKQQVIWSYVVEDPSTSQLTDFFSFYCLESSVINNSLHSNVRAAYCYYYASTLGIPPIASLSDYKARLNALMNDALILAKKYKFDVFNALTLQDNNWFLEQQSFGGGDGQLHYYLYNYRANPIAGGVDRGNQIHGGGSGVGVVML